MKPLFICLISLFWYLFACGQTDEWKTKLPRKDVYYATSLISCFDSLFMKTESQSNPKQALVSFARKLDKQYQELGLIVIDEEIVVYIDSMTAEIARSEGFFHQTNPFGFSVTYLDFLKYIAENNENIRPYVNSIRMTNDILGPSTYDLLLTSNNEFGFEKPEIRLIYYLQLLATLKEGY